MLKESAAAEKSLLTPFNVVAGLIIIIGFILTVLRFTGGLGAVREVTDLVLKAAGLYGLALTRLADEAWRPTPQELSSDAPASGPGTESKG